MTRPTARVLALLEILQNGGTRTVDDLAERLGVDELVGLVTGPRSDAGTSRLAAESAAAKVRRVLPKPLAARVDALLDVTDFPGRASTDPPPEADVLLLVAGAARARRTVEILHTSRDGRTTERTVEPYGVVAHAGHWYLTGRDASGDEIRTFRLDRVSTARPGSTTFEVPADFRAQDEVFAALARTPWRHTVSVRVHAGADAVRSRLPAGMATLTPVVDEHGWTRVEMRVEHLDWVPGVFASLDADLVVEGPDELRHRFLVLAQRLLAASGEPVPAGGDPVDRGPV